MSNFRPFEIWALVVIICLILLIFWLILGFYLSPLMDPLIFFFFFFFLRFSLSSFPLLTLSSRHFFFFPIASNPLLSFSCVLIFLALIHAKTLWQWALNLIVLDKNKLKEKKSNTKTHSSWSLHFGCYSPERTEIAKIHHNGPKFILEFVLMGFVSQNGFCLFIAMNVPEELPYILILCFFVCLSTQS